MGAVYATTMCVPPVCPRNTTCTACSAQARAATSSSWTRRLIAPSLLATTVVTKSGKGNKRSLAVSATTMSAWSVWWIPRDCEILWRVAWYASRACLFVSGNRYRCVCCGVNCEHRAVCVGVGGGRWDIPRTHAATTYVATRPACCTAVYWLFDRQRRCCWLIMRKGSFTVLCDIRVLL